MRTSNPIVIVLAVIGAIVVLGLLLKIAFKLIGLLLVIAAGLVIYFFVQRATGARR